MKLYNETFLEKLRRFFRGRSFFGFLPFGGYYEDPIRTFDKGVQLEKTIFPVEESPVILEKQEVSDDQDDSIPYYEEDEDYNPYQPQEEEEYEEYKEPWFGDDDDLSSDGLFDFPEDDFSSWSDDNN